MLNRSFALFLFFFSFLLQVKSQIIQVSDATTPPFTPENLIRNYFLGEGIEVLSVKYEGAPEAVGYFNNAQGLIGIERGIVLTNGRVQTTGSGPTIRYGIDAASKNIANNDNLNNPKDDDIDKIISTSIAPNVKSTNLSKYTISFIPSADTLRFKYVFASEEYPEYICQNYNDIFGFFISGPGITGPFQNNGQNIALIPNTNLPVSINNINLGNASLANCPPKFPQYYNNNNNTNFEPVYDAFLNAFVAQAVVQPCQVYTIKLVIADLEDANYDSAVFLEAKSFGTGTIKVDRVTQASDNTVIEGCQNGSITFKLPKMADKDTPLKCNLIGSAQNGIDYKKIQTNFFIPKGDSTLTVKIEGLEDLVTEGTETIGFDIQRDICRRDTFWFFIKDNQFSKNPRKTINDTTICKGQEIQFDATVKATVPNNPKFENKDSTQIVTIIPNSSNTPTILPITVSNVAPPDFNPSIIESVCLNIRHGWIDDVDVYLIAPNGQFIALSTDNGGSGDNMSNTCFRPDATKDIRGGTAPFTGDWLPEEKFSNLVSTGDNPTNGVWKLLVIDDQPAGFVGKVLDWSITFKSNYKIEYQWNTNQNISCSDCPMPIVKPSNNFDYQVEIKDIYGCKFKDTASVTLLDSLAAPSIICGITTHTNLTFSWLPIQDAKGYEISLNGGAWQDVGNDVAYKLNGLAPGLNAHIAVRAKGGLCFAKTSTKTCETKPCNTVIPEIDFINHVSCRGKNDGSVNLIVLSGGTPPFTYQMGALTTTNGGFKDLAPGNYKVSITDANTCAATVEFQIIEPLALSVQLFADSVTCTNGADAIALANPDGGTAPYSYLWSNSSTENLNERLKKGNYIVTVSDSRGCKIVDSIKVFEPKPIKMILNTLDPSCFEVNDGSAKAFVETGGTPPFEYLWDTNLGQQTTSKVIGLSPGIHRVTATDSRGCTVSSPIFISAPQKLGISETVTKLKCFGEKNAKIDVALNGGIAPYKYKWSTGDSTSILTNLAAGVFYLTATDFNKCRYLDTINILNPDSLNIIKQNRQNVRCYEESNGAVDLNVSGGNGLYFYQWSNNETGPNIKNIKAGIYFVTITDGNACAKTDSVHITEPDSLKIAPTIKNTDCLIPNSGAISTLITGGNQPYNYEWKGPDNFTSIDPNINSIKTGTYTLKLTDNKGCNKVDSFKVIDPIDFKITESITNVKCKGDLTGAINLTITNGNQPFKFSWSNNINTKDLSAIGAGSYTVTVSDASNCSVVNTFKVEEPDQALDLQISGIDTLCFGLKNGTLSATTVGGTTPYTYEWNTGATNNELKDLEGGLYKLTVTDKNGCVTIKQREIANFGKISAKLNEIKAKCHNSDDASLEISEVFYNQITNPLTSFLYKWSNGSTNTIANNLSAGNSYNVTITNQRGCTAIESYKLFKPEPPVIILISSQKPSCNLGNDGSIEVKGSGGTSPFTFEWSNGEIGDKISDLSNGDFTVTMSDANGCNASVFFTLVKPNQFTLTTESINEKCKNTTTGVAKLKIDGGTPPYNISWNTGENTPTIEKLAAGNYTYTVTDKEGCFQSGNIKIDSAVQLLATFAAQPVRCGGLADGVFSIFAKGGLAPYQYSINGKAFSSQSKYVAQKAGSYEVIVKDANGCQTELQIPIIQPQPIVLNLGRDTAINFGEKYRIPTEIENVYGEPKYTWFPDDIQLINCNYCKNPIVSPKVSTLYTLTVKDSIGCSAFATVNIVVKVNTKIFVPSGFSPNGDGENDRLLVHGDKDAEILSFDIFDRWGEQVFSDANFLANDPNRGWDGFFREQSMSSGTYAYTLKVKFKDGSTSNFKGIVNLIR